VQAALKDLSSALALVARRLELVEAPSLPKVRDLEHFLEDMRAWRSKRRVGQKALISALADRLPADDVAALMRDLRDPVADIDIISQLRYMTVRDSVVLAPHERRLLESENGEAPPVLPPPQG
jgi:hypothetical protein